MCYRYIFFDLDGVILDSMPYHAQAWIEAFSLYNVYFTKEEVYLNEGSIEFEVIKKLFENKNLSIDEETFKKILSDQKNIFLKKYIKFIKPFKEVPQLIKDLKKSNKKLALVTSSDKEIIEKDLPEDIKVNFDVIITADKIKKRKPHPEPYLKAIELLKAEIEKSVAVENSPTGVLSAKTAGLKCIAITTTLPKEKLKLADIVISTHKELKKILMGEIV
ncbi:MAG: HAD family phosphatase [Endomicrobiia bacterium]